MTDISPSPWVVHWAAQISTHALALDIACGAGRHSKLLLSRGLRVVAVDINIDGMKLLAGRRDLELIQADLENGPWPFPERNFDAVVVTNYLYRPIFPHLLAALKPGGMLIYETFAAGNGEFGRPSNPNFLLQPGELLAMVDGVARVIAYEDVYIETPKPALLQRICAVANGAAQRYFPAPGN